MTTTTTTTTTTTRATAATTARTRAAKRLERRATRARVAARASGDRGTSASTSRDDGRNRIGAIVAATALAMGALGTDAARAIDMQIVDSSTSEYMRRRDEAAAFKCKGGMFDCDSDRREYARAQTERLQARIATRDPEMGAEEALKSSPCTVEDPCTDNVLQAAFAGVQGLTTSEKLEKMGRPTDAVNSSSQYFGF